MEGLQVVMKVMFSSIDAEEFMKATLVKIDIQI